MLSLIPISTTSMRSRAVLAARAAGRISSATPRAGSGLQLQSGSRRKGSSVSSGAADGVGREQLQGGKASSLDERSHVKCTVVWALGLRHGTQVAEKALNLTRLALAPSRNHELRPLRHEWLESLRTCHRLLITREWLVKPAHFGAEEALHGRHWEERVSASSSSKRRPPMSEHSKNPVIVVTFVSDSMRASTPRFITV